MKIGHGRHHRYLDPRGKKMHSEFLESGEEILERRRNET